jgi:hypothetical protein
MPSLGASSVARFRSSTSGNGNVACFAVWFPIHENIMPETLDFHSSFRSRRFERFSRASNVHQVKRLIWTWLRELAREGVFGRFFRHCIESLLFENIF